MGYKIYEMTQEKHTEIIDHAEKAYEHIGKMLECIESMNGQIGKREGDDWYVRQGRGLNHRYGIGYRDDMDDMDERYGMRRGYGHRYGNREPYFM